MGITPVADKTEIKIFYDRLFTTYYNYICVVVSRLITSKDDVDDIVSETFVACWQAIDKLKDHPNTRRWLVKTAKNKVKHYMRDVDKRAKIHTAVMAAGMNSVENDFMGHGFLSSLRKADEEILRLFYEKGMSLLEIAAIYKIKESAAKERLYRARLRLGKLLTENKMLKNYRNMCYLLAVCWNI
jgi:RNA polymerase sigma-70 factor (ECF subfamily)